MSKIKVIIKKADEPVGHVALISNTLKNLQNHVGGYIETLTIGNIVIICNEDARILKLPYNCTVLDVTNFFGDILVAGYEGEDFSDVPISLNVWKKLIGVKK